MACYDINILCQYLDWDSDFFGFRIARVIVNRLCQEDMEGVLMWCKSNAIKCLYFLGDANNTDTIRVVEDNKFRFMDIRVTLERELEDIPVSAERGIQSLIRPYMPDDVPALRAIAKMSHCDSRFYYDSNFPVYLCDAIYETWIEKSCKGYADAVLVAELYGRPVGYISCHLLNQAKGQIGLCGVSADSQGHGLGQLLVNESVRWFAAQGIKQVAVVTQGRNCRAQSLYQRCGFLTRSVQLWYHRWFSTKKFKVAK